MTAHPDTTGQSLERLTPRHAAGSGEASPTCRLQKGPASPRQLVTERALPARRNFSYVTSVFPQLGTPLGLLRSLISFPAFTAACLVLSSGSLESILPYGLIILRRDHRPSDAVSE